MTKGEKTRLKILEAASRCISKIGVEKTSITNIALEAELKRPLIAYHFPKKDRIFLEVVKSIIVNLSIELDELQSQKAKDGRQGIIEILTLYIDFFQNNSHYFHCFLHFFYMASIKNEYRDLNTKIKTIALSRIGEKVELLLKENDLNIDNKYIYNFTDLLYTKVFGTIINLQTLNHAGNYQDHKSEWQKILNKEIDLFVYYSKEKAF